MCNGRNGATAPNVATEIAKPITSLKLYNTLKLVFNSEVSHSSKVKLVETRDAVEKLNRDSKILLVEDNLDNQKLAKSILGKFGYAIDVAEDGQSALEAATKRRYDLILMDIQMPIMDGFEVTSKIREWEREHEVPATPIIALTAHAIAGYREKCLANEMNDYLTKPVTKKALIAKVEEWLASHRPVSVVDGEREGDPLALTPV
jgi:CheY-like chemotaxis protein